MEQDVNIAEGASSSQPLNTREQDAPATLKEIL